MSRSNSPRAAKGFSLLEVVIAISVLVIGVSAMAALSATMLTRGHQSKYVSLAGTLASEKLEDLNRLTGLVSAGVDNSDPNICVPSPATSEGSLTADTSASITCAGATETIYYYDNVSLDVTNSTDCPNPADGCFAETTTGLSGGSTAYYTTYHSPDGTIPNGGASASSPVSSATAPTNLTFHRRWVIEASPLINGTAVSGIRRVTVLVTLLDQTVQPGVTFQMSIVRP